MHEELHDSDPEDKGREGMPHALGCTSPKDIASIHMALRAKGDDLLDLPWGMHRHASVGFGHISLAKNQVKIRVFLAKMSKGIAQVLDIVKGDSSDIPREIMLLRAN